MSKEQTADLFKFLAPFGPESIELALWLREFVWDMYPDANELVYDNYNAVAFGWSLTEKLGQVFCNVAIWRTNGKVIFGFNRGTELYDPQKLLIGNGKQYRYLPVNSKEEFPADYVAKIIADSYPDVKAGLKDTAKIIQGFTITKSVSPVQRKPVIKAVKKK